MATVLPGAQVSPSGDQGPQGPPGVAGPSGPVGTGSGDVNGPASSVDNEVALFNATTGKLLKRSTGTGYLKVTSGVLQTPAALTKADVGLSNVDNTSDANKPVSTAQQTALNLKQDTSAKGNANGYASLDSGGKVPAAQIPPLAGTGDVVGPASSTDGGVPLFSGTTGKLIKQSTPTELAAAINPTIWYQRLRSFNTIGNPNFEVDQIYSGGQVAGWGAGSGGGFYLDRWWHNFGGGTTTVVTAGTMFEQVFLPGTSYPVSPNYFRYTLTTQDASMGTVDQVGMGQSIEGPTARELFGGPHSISLLARSSVANLKFSIALTTLATPWRSLVRLCTLGAANTWTLISLPNIPVWDSGGTWSSLAGNISYDFYITLGAGSTSLNATQNIWLTNWFIGVTGQDNFASNPVGSTFDVTCVQHEPGPECTTSMPKHFNENYQECQRYYQKSYSYWNVVGTNTSAGSSTFHGLQSGSNIWGSVRFPVTMAVTPTLDIWTPSGTSNGFKDVGTASVYGMIGVSGLAEGGFSGIITNGTLALSSHYAFHWRADCKF